MLAGGAQNNARDSLQIESVGHLSGHPAEISAPGKRYLAQCGYDAWMIQLESCAWNVACRVDPVDG